jgi:hypothetical protein
VAVTPVAPVAPAVPASKKAKKVTAPNTVEPAPKRGRPSKAASAPSSILPEEENKEEGESESESDSDDEAVLVSTPAPTTHMPTAAGGAMTSIKVTAEAAEVLRVMLEDRAAKKQAAADRETLPAILRIDDGEALLILSAEAADGLVYNTGSWLLTFGCCLSWISSGPQPTTVEDVIAKFSGGASNAVPAPQLWKALDKTEDLISKASPTYGPAIATLNKFFHAKHNLLVASYPSEEALVTKTTGRIICTLLGAADQQLKGASGRDKHVHQLEATTPARLKATWEAATLRLADQLQASATARLHQAAQPAPGFQRRDAHAGPPTRLNINNGNGGNGNGGGGGGSNAVTAPPRPSAGNKTQGAETSTDERCYRYNTLAGCKWQDCKRQHACEFCKATTHGQASCPKYLAARSAPGAGKPTADA